MSDEPTAMMEAPAAPEPSSGRARLKRRADDVLRGLWAAVFYSGRVSGKSVVLCSSDRREGASTMAAGLAVAGSTPAGVARVALVDMNLRAPAQHKLFRTDAKPGVFDAVIGGAAPESVARRISPSLDVYPAGEVSGRALDVLRNERLPAFMRELERSYDHVLVDVAPANASPDVQVLAGICPDMVLVTRTDRTPREAVAQARKRIEVAGGKVVGLVLNLRRYPIPRFLYRRV